MPSDLPSVFQPLRPDDPREVGGYRVFARLGAGGMGRVYLSYTPGGRPVALKVVRPEFAEDAEFRRRFAQEVASAQRIHGLYTAQVIDSGTAADAPWLVTAYVPGPSLQQVIREHGALPVRTVLLLTGGIAEALQAIHSVQVVHRDLKPANVLVAADGPRVIDFGIARAADATALTGTGFRIGSPAFMSPEQAQGRPVTPATDVFALGALAAYAAGGTPPFGEGPETAVLYRVVHEQPDLGNVPDGLRGLLERCLAKRPEDRPAPAEIIDAARSHPSVGGQLRFTDDWLPASVGTEITRRADLPRTPPAPAAPAGAPMPTLPATAPLSATPPVAPPSVPPSAPPSAPPGGQAPAVRGSVSWKVLLAAVAATALVAAGVGVTLSSGGKDGGSAAKGGASATAPGSTAVGTGTGTGTGKAGTAGEGSAAPSAARWTAVYRDTVLSIAPQAHYEFDLTAGKVVPDDEAAWAVGTYGPEFRLKEKTDAFVARGSGPLTPEACSAGIDSSPLTKVLFEDVPAGSSFCVRARGTGDVVVLRTVRLGDNDGAATCSLTYYRNDG